MAIKFYNIKSKEIRVAETEPLIAALYNSSDKGPNANNMQDFGWRLAPEVVIQMKRIKNDPEKILEIASRFRKSFDEVGDTDVLQYISLTTRTADAPVAQEADYEDEYRAEIAKLEKKSLKEKPAPVTEDDEEEDDIEIEEVSEPLDKTKK